MKRGVRTFTMALAGIVLTAALVGGCTPPVTEGEGSLYNRLAALANGDGKAAIALVVDEFLKEVAADKRINQRFANANLPRLRQLLIDQVCEVSGGPCKYTGMDMVTAHKGMNITESEFIALVEDFRKAWMNLGLPIHEMNELVGLLAPLKRDITYQ